MLVGGAAACRSTPSQCAAAGWLANEGWWPSGDEKEVADADRSMPPGELVDEDEPPADAVL